MLFRQNSVGAINAAWKHFNSACSGQRRNQCLAAADIALQNDASVFTREIAFGDLDPYASGRQSK